MTDTMTAGMILLGYIVLCVACFFVYIKTIQQTEDVTLAAVFLCGLISVIPILNISVAAPAVMHYLTKIIVLRKKV